MKKGSKNKEKPDEEIFVPEEPKYTFDDIILPEKVREQIMNVADYAENSRIVFEDWGLSETHKYSKRIGINLYGEPGTGKTWRLMPLQNIWEKNSHRKLC